MFSYIAGDEGRSIAIVGSTLVLLIGDELPPGGIEKLERLLDGATFEEAQAMLAEGSASELRHYALLATRGGGIDEFAAAVGGRGSAMVWRGSRTVSAENSPEAPMTLDEPKLPVTAGPVQPVKPAQPADAEAPVDHESTNPFDHLFEHTQFFGVEAAAVRPEEHHENEAPSAPAHGVFELILPNGERQPIDRPVLIGRQPEVPRDTDLADFRLLKISDSHTGLSRRHVRVDPYKDGVMVTDLGSTNGTALISGASSQTLEPDAPVRAQAGDELLLAGSLTISIAHAR